MLGADLGGLLGMARERLVGRLAGLTDQEYFWEPVDVCWSVRQADGGWRPDLGADGTPWTSLSPPPVTTIAWRLWHLGASRTPSWPPTSISSARAFADSWFAPRPVNATALESAAVAVDAVGRHWAAVGALVSSFDDTELLGPIGPVGGPFKDSSVLGLILHVADELIHHSAEIALLRDLYAGRIGAPLRPD